MSQVKARLSVVLMADSVTVAEVEDPRLWQQVLNVINGDAATIEAQQRSSNLTSGKPSGQSHHSSSGDFQVGNQGDSTVAQFADFLQLDRAVVEGACSPTSTEPYMHLDLHCWEAFKNQVTNFSGRSIPPISMTATLLLCWSRFGGIATVTQASLRKILGTVNIIDKNPARGLKSVTWLSMRTGGAVVLNPAEISKAQLASRCFCKKDWADWKAQS